MKLRCTSLLIVYLQDYAPPSNNRDPYDATEKPPENGGISPRFSNRLRNAAASSTVDNFEKQFLRVLHKVYQTIEKNEIRLAEQDRRDAIKLEWQQVALVVDRVLLYIFVAATVTVTFVILFHAPNSVISMFGGGS